MKKNVRLLIVAILSLITISATAQIYTFTNNSAGVYNTVDPNATGQNLALFNNAMPPGSPCATGFTSNNYTTTTVFDTTLGCVEAMVAANSGYQLNVTDFSVDLRRSGTGPANARLAYSVDGGTTWIDKGSDDIPHNGGCGSTTTATWSSALTVLFPATLRFRIYGFNASGTGGNFQVLNLNINGTVGLGSANSITTQATAYGPFCSSASDTLHVSFTSTGTYTSNFFVQLSDSGGVFPTNSTSNLISTGAAASPLIAIIPAGTQSGTSYRVRVVNNNPTVYASGTNGSNIIINPSPTPALTIADTPAPICSRHLSMVYITSINDTGTAPTYQWQINGVNSGTGSILTHSFANGDSVRCVLTSNAVCANPTIANSNTLHIVVNPTKATVLFDTICPGTTFPFKHTTYGVTGSVTDSLHTQYGCDSIVTLNLYVRPLLRDTLPTTICTGGNVTFKGHPVSNPGFYSDTVRCDSIFTLHLFVNTNIKRDTIQDTICQGTSHLFNTHTLTTAGFYSDTVRCDSFVVLHLTIHSKPAPIVSNQLNLHITQLQTNLGYATYQWFACGNDTIIDSLIHGAIRNIYGPSISQNNNYFRVLVTDSFGCSDTSNAVRFVIVGIESVTNDIEAMLFPNPTHSKATLTYTLSANSLIQITLFDLVGNKVEEITNEQQHAGKHTQQIGLNQLTAGTYLLQIKTAQGSVQKRLIIE